MAASNHPFGRRKNIRFRPDSPKVAWIAKQDLKVTRGLVRDESLRGCALILQSAVPLQVGESCFLKVGLLETVEAQVAWVSPLKDGFYKAGFSYLD
jgi:hypothetical protein